MQHEVQPTQSADKIDNIVKAEFFAAWSSYKTYAWGHDELLPISNSPFDWYSTPLFMTPIDSLDSLMIMGFKDEADSTRHFIDTQVSFDQDIMVKTFDVNIRLVGGLLSAYQLSGDQRLLELAQDLGNRLLAAFNSPTGMPYLFVNLRTGEVSGTHAGPAEVGTYLIEFGTLSKLTGDPKFYDAAKRALVAIFSRRSQIDLIGSEIDVETGEWINTTSTIGPGSDSYYEYLYKSTLLFDDPDLNFMWSKTITAVQRYLADPLPSGLWYGQADMYTGTRVSTLFGAFDSFFASILARSGDVPHAAALQSSSFSMWTANDIEPVMIDYSTQKIVQANYSLNPETIESAYYLYFYTGDPKYQNSGRVMLSSLEKYCRTQTAFANLQDVRTKQKADRMQSFVFAETLKYLYLLFSSPNPVNLDEMVLNTEAHPIRKTW